MKLFLSFLLLLITAGISGMLIFLNQESVVLILTPAYKGLYYTLPEMPMGLLVVLAFLFGFFLGYVGGILSKLFRV